MVVDIGQVLDVDANVDRRQGVVWEGIPETRLYEVFENEKKSEICGTFANNASWPNIGKRQI